MPDVIRRDEGLVDGGEPFRDALEVRPLGRVLGIVNAQGHHAHAAGGHRGAHLAGVHLLGDAQTDAIPPEALGEHFLARDAVEHRDDGGIGVDERRRLLDGLGQRAVLHGVQDDLEGFLRGALGSLIVGQIGDADGLAVERGDLGAIALGAGRIGDHENALGPHGGPEAAGIHGPQRPEPDNGDIFNRLHRSLLAIFNGGNAQREHGAP